MGETPQIQVCQACSVIPKKTQGCNHCQKVLQQCTELKGLNIYVNVIFQLQKCIKNLLQRAQDLRLGRRFTFQQYNNPKHTAKTMQEWLRYRSLNVLEWPSQSLDVNPMEHLWRDPKIAVQQHSPSNLTKLERICREEWEKLPKYRCAKLVASYPRRFVAVITAKGASTKY